MRRVPTASMSLLMRAGALLAAVLLAGCPAPMDTPDGGTGPDASDGTGAGLVFAFESKPEPGHDVGGDFDPILQEAELRLEDIRAIGDAAPGDEHTSISDVEMEWEEAKKKYLRFDKAPPGMYSQLLGEVTSYEISGTVLVAEQVKSFAIKESSVELAFTIGLSNVDLEPSVELEIPIHVKVKDVIRAIDWDAVPEDSEGVLRVGADSDQISVVRDEIQGFFEAKDPKLL